MTGRAWGPSCKNWNAQYEVWILLPLHPVTAGWCFLEISCTKRRHVILESWNPARGGCIPRNDHLERNMLNFNMMWSSQAGWTNTSPASNNPWLKPHKFRPTSSNDYLCFLQTARNPYVTPDGGGVACEPPFGMPHVFPSHQKKHLAVLCIPLKA